MGGKGRVIRIWNATTGDQIRELRGHKEWANVLAFSPDGKQLASGGFSIRGGFAMGNPNLGSADLSDSIHLWDVATGTDLRQFPGDPADKVSQDRSVNALAFTRDGRTLISGEENGSIVLYDTSSAAIRTTLKGHLNSVRAVRIFARRPAARVGKHGPHGPGLGPCHVVGPGAIDSTLPRPGRGVIGYTKALEKVPKLPSIAFQACEALNWRSKLHKPWRPTPRRWDSRVFHQTAGRPIPGSPGSGLTSARRKCPDRACRVP